MGLPIARATNADSPLALTFTACGGSSDPAELTRSGHKALGTQDFAGAHESFEAALSAMGEDTSNPLYLEAKLGSIEARATTYAEQAKDELIALSAALPGQVTDKDFNRIANRMGDAGKYAEAIALLDVADDAYPDSEHLKKLGARLAEDASKGGDSDALEMLKGMGYVGE